MKHIFQIYALLSLLIIAAMSVLSYGAGAGYVYVLWHDIQVQTNLWVVVFFALFVSFLLQILWLWLKRLMVKVKRQQDNMLSFNQLHPYEQLGVIWILQAAEGQQRFIKQTFDQSGLLKYIIDARLLIQQEQYAEALKVLESSPATAFELAEIERVEIFLAQNDGAQARTHLEFLSAHDLSPWLSQVHQAFLQRLSALWGDFAVHFPWLYLDTTESVTLTVEMQALWLTQLLAQFEQADTDQIFHLQQRYEAEAQNLDALAYSVKKLWLKLLTHLPDLSIQHDTLALHLLAEQFVQDVFYLWFQHQLLKQNPNYTEVEQQLNQFEAQYPGIPVFTFVRWHIYNATERMEDANQLLDLYPDNVLMNYLRVKSELNGNEKLIQQLNSIYEKDTNFIAFKL